MSNSMCKSDENSMCKSDEYGMPLFHDIEGYEQPTFVYKPFIPVKCTRTSHEHIPQTRYLIRERCRQCESRLRGSGRVDDICHCE
jgi:hypothetical protein